MRRRLQLTIIGAICAVLLAACGSGSSKSTATTAPPAPAPAGDLRTDLNLAMSEYSQLLAKSTNAVLGGRNDNSEAYEDKLNATGADIGGLFANSFGIDAE